MDERRENYSDPETPTKINYTKQLRANNMSPMVWKILRAHIKEEISQSLESCGLFSKNKNKTKQEGCVRGTTDTNYD